MSLRDECVGELTAWLEALSRHASPAHARIGVGPARASYARVWDELQGYARPLWGMVALAASGEGSRLGTDVWTRWRSGLVAGTDPTHREYWGKTHDHCQAFCEMPPIALALLWARREMWDPLDEVARARIVAWLLQINDFALHANNWLFFRVLVNLALIDATGAGDLARVHADLRAIDELAADDGWYTDGAKEHGRAADGYVAFAFHVYGLLAAELIAPRDPERAEALRVRARRFAANWRWFTNDRGAMLAWGRSLCYRWTPAAFWAACAGTGVPVLPWPEIAACWRAQHRWWAERPLLDANGILTLGFTWENPHLAEGYIAHTSPYWMSKIWLGLRQPETHPFWRGGEQRPAERPASLPLAGCGGLLAGSQSEPLLLLVGQQGSRGMRGAAARYRNFAYDCRHGFQLPGKREAFLPDNALLLRRWPWSRWLGRTGRDERWSVTTDGAELAWSPAPWARVKTRLVPLENGYRREHHISLDRSVDVVEGGFACPLQERSATTTNAVVRGGGLGSHLQGFDSRRAGILDPAPGKNLLHPRVALPVLRGRLPRGEHALVSHTTFE